MSDNKQTFEQYADYVIRLKERVGAKHKTIELYRRLISRINDGIGHIRICDLKPQHLNNLYEQLSKEGLKGNSQKSIAKKDLKETIRKQGFTFDKLAKASGAAVNTISVACKQKPIMYSKASAIAEALGLSYSSLFRNADTNATLSNKTIIEHHRLISTILTQAEKEMLIMYNPARKASPPKQDTKQANYFQPEDLERIRECLETEQIKWKVFVHLLLITGARRGEIAGLKWDIVEWKKRQIHICNNLLYTSAKGIYSDTTKTASSDRYITLPKETMELLKEYRKWYLNEAQKYGDRWHNTNYIFFQEKSGNEGKPINPDSITKWLLGFSKRHDLPHINPHAFRHTMASILYYNGADSVSISKRLGHSKVSTTTDIYSHIIKQADEQNAELIADAILRPVKKQA